MLEITDTLERIIESMPEGIILSDTHDSLIFVNKSFHKILGYQNRIVTEPSFLDYLADEEQKNLVIEIEQETSQVCTVYETYLRDSKGERVAVQVTASIISDASNSPIGILRIINSIADSRRKDLISEHHQNLIHVFASLLQHDIRNDLQVILGYIESVLMLSSDLSPAAMSMLDAAKSAALRMSGIITAFNKADKFAEIDLVSLLQRVIKESCATHIELDIDLKVDKQSEPLIVIGTPLLSSAFHNIFRNTVQHGGPLVRVEVTVQHVGNRARITIVDNGPGIPPEKLKTLFKRPSHLQTNGIGLYLTHHIIIACGGSIRADTEPNKGAKFVIELPILSC